MQEDPRLEGPQEVFVTVTNCPSSTGSLAKVGMIWKPTLEAL